MDKAHQAKMISDKSMLGTIHRLQWEPYNLHPIPHWVHVWVVCEQFPGVPHKVVQAKLRALLRRKLLTGCGCGCRGDFELTDSGRTLIETS